MNAKTMTALAALLAASALGTAAPAQNGELRCPDKDCPVATVIATGSVDDPKTGRKFFLDYPKDLKPGEKVVFVLNLHGGGSFGNWQRHYFPIVDQVDRYRLGVGPPP